MTITHAGTFASNPAGTATTNAVAYSTVTLGDLVLVTSAVSSSTVTITGLSGGGVTTWTKIQGLTGDELWWGPVTTVGAVTLTATYSAAITSSLSAEQYTNSTGAGTTWSVVTSSSNIGASSTTLTYPSLTATAAGQLWFGFAVPANVGAVGATAGFTYQIDNSTWTNVIAYQVLAASGAVTAPTASQSPAGTSVVMGAIMAASSNVALTRGVADTAAASDAVARSAAHPRAATDTAAAGDAAPRIAAGTRTAVDSALASDAVARTTSRSRTTADSATASDAVVRTSGPTRTAADSATASDTTARAAAITRAATDTAAASDAVARFVAHPRPVADTAAASDTASQSRGAARPVADTATASDGAVRTVTESRLVSDSAAATDAVPGNITTSPLYAGTATSVSGPWTNTAGAQGPTAGDYAIWSSVAAGSSATLDLTGFGSGTVTSGAVVQSVSVTVRHHESDPSTFATVQAQLYIGSTPLASLTTLTRSSTDIDDVFTIVGGITYADLANLKVRLISTRA